MTYRYFSLLLGLVTRAVITFVGVVGFCVAQQRVLDAPEGICPMSVNNQFRAFQRMLAPTCSAMALPTQHLDEFLSFEQWKSLKLSETPVTMYQGSAPPMETPAVVGSSDIPTSHPISSSWPSDTAHMHMPSLRVPLTDRFNYASQDCSARIHVAHKSSKSPSSILSSKRDKYMLSPCSVPNRFVVVELCDDIQIDTIQLANFEFFSGVFKDFTVSVAQTYDAGQWTVVGTYRAKNVRSVQSFHPAQDTRFYRYVRIDFLSHYGNEYYCPVSLLRVYGLTQMEEYKWDEWQAAWRRERDAAHAPLALGAVEYVAQAEHHDPIDAIPALPEEIMATAELIITSESVPFANESGSPSPSASPDQPPAAIFFTTAALPSESVHLIQNLTVEVLLASEKEIQEIVDSIMVDDIELPDALSISDTTHSAGLPSSSEDVSPPSTLSSELTRIPTSTGTLEVQLPPTTITDSPPSSSTFLDVVSSVPPIAHAEKSPTDAESTVEDRSTSSVIPVKSSDNAAVAQLTPSPSMVPKSTTIHVSTQSRHTASSSSTSGPGESIYRTIMNRLGVLESNSSLGVRYVEDQTRSIRDALRRLEENIGRLESISNYQQQALRKTLTELQQHKREMELERSTLLSQVHSLSHEVTLEKRLGIAQLCLLLVVLIFMTLTRGAPLSANFLDGLSVSNSVVSGVKRRGSLWRARGWARTNSEPEPPRLPELVRVQQRSPDSSRSRDAQLTPPTLPFPSLQSPRASNSRSSLTTTIRSSPRLVDIQSPPHLRSPFTQHPTNHRSPPTLFSSPASTSNFPSSEDAAGLPQSLSRKEYASRGESSLDPGSARRAIAKTAHLHEVARRRRVSSHSKASHEGATSSENRPDVLGGSPPSGSSSKARNRPASQGATGTESERAKRGAGSFNAKGKGREVPSYPVSSPGTWAEQVSASFLASLPPSAVSDHQESDDQATPSAVGSDAWEDTSDPGDDSVDGDTRDDNDDTFQGQQLSPLLDYGPSNQQPQSQGILLSEPLTPRSWPPKPSANVEVSYSTESRRTVPPVGVQ